MGVIEGCGADSGPGLEPGEGEGTTDVGERDAESRESVVAAFPEFETAGMLIPNIFDASAILAHWIVAPRWLAGRGRA